MTPQIGLIVAGLAIGVILLFWLRSRSWSSGGDTARQSAGGRNYEDAQASVNDRRLTETEIRELLRTIPAAGWHGAQEIQSRLTGEDKAITRKAALEMLASVNALSVEDYWTLRSLTEIAGHPIPRESILVIIRQFRRMDTNREMLGPTLVLIGNEEAGRALVEAEEASEGRYMSRIAFPLDDAVEHGRLEAGFSEALSKHFAARAEKDPKTFAKKGLVHLWVLVDPLSAVEQLTREPFWNPDFEGHWDVLQALAKNAAKVPEERLWAFDEELKRRAIVDKNALYPNPDVVWLLARIHSARVDPLIEKLRQRPDMADQALAAEAALRGIIRPRRVVHRHLESPGFYSSPAPVRHFWALELLGMELVNGGIHQYFFNSAGDLWPDALDGLDQAGYTKSAAAFRKAISVFGQTPPSTNRAVRFRELDQLSKGDEKALNGFGDQVYEDMKETNMWPYIMRNAEIFRTELPRQSSQQP